MPNLHKKKRNAEIVSLFAGGQGLTHKQIAEKLGMKESAVSMVIHREKQRQVKEVS
jgi:DNA-binding NarL/FixJ family response regulator